MTNKTISEVVLPLLEREFDPNETMTVLTYDRIKYWSWGVSKKINIQNKGLLLTVKGNLFKGDVLITLGWDDTYKVYIISSRGKILDTYEMVYFDVLAELIDDRIERIDKYKR